MTLQDPLVGRVVDGRYLVESRIARGGMATVYRALDRRLDREVALKVMHDTLADDEEFVSRFVREARAAARLSHPNVVQVFDQGADDSVLYLAMEYLPGRTLRDVLTERGALTPRESVSVLEPVLGALGAAHRAGIVHRDVKPENVILADDGRIKVADFGLAGAITGPISRTASGELLGTVAYLSPELVSRGIADARADVYAAGIMLFELLTGKQPFTGDDPLQVAYRHVHETVPAPTSISPELPVAFDDVVLRATSQNPDHRPADADALLAELHYALGQVPDNELDLRALEASTLRMHAAARTQAFGSVGLAPAVAPADGAPAAAAGPQPTSVLSVSRRSAMGRGGGAPMVPRLRVHDDEPPPPGFLGDRTRQGITAIVGVILVATLIFTGVWWFTNGPGSYTTTPSLVGVQSAEAQRALLVAGLRFDARKVFSDKVASGQVVSTVPVAGENVKKDGTVVLNISKGPELVAVPTLKGKSEADAQAAIEKANLKLGDVKRKFSATVDKGTVISSSPTADSKVAPQGAVNLLISKGSEPVLLDNVLNQNFDQAKQLLESKGLKVERQEQDFVNGAPQPGTVVQQDPQALGQTVAKGSTVRLTVVKAAEGQQGIPDVRGKNFDEARQILQSQGFQVRRDGFFGDKVQDQQPQGQAPAGTEITLRVGF
jgi:beta-lactam-binding protein with PASTA domain/tRNA A-37 threonylcarbamoyl transferase component Bud32